MTVQAGVERQSKVRQDNIVVAVVTLQANYDRLWLHVRIIYVLQAVLMACFLITAYAVFCGHRSSLRSAPAVALDSTVAWRNLSNLDDRVTEVGKLEVGRRRRSTPRRQTVPDDVETLTRRLRAARDTRPSSSSWTSRHDDPAKHDGLWMTMHSNVPVMLQRHIVYA